MADKLRKNQNEGISSVLEIAKMIRGEELHGSSINEAPIHCLLYTSFWLLYTALEG